MKGIFGNLFKHALKRVFFNKFYYISIFISLVVLGVLKYVHGTITTFPISALKLVVACFVGAIVGEFIGWSIGVGIGKKLRKKHDKK